MAAPQLSIPRDKLITFRFQGGPRDGQESRSDVPVQPGCVNDAQSFWLLTNMGEVGHQFAGLSPRVEEMISKGVIDKDGRITGIDGPIDKYRYGIKEKQETASEIVLICDFKGTGE